MTALAFLARFWRPIVALGAALCITLFVRSYGDHRYEAGITAQQAADDKASAVLRARVAELTVENQRRATQAHETYEVEHAQTVVAARQPLTARELCGPADDRVSRVPAPGTAQPGDAAQPAAAAMVQQMPQIDSGVAADRLGLLAALAGLADDDSSVIREYQGRAAGLARQSLLP